MIRDAIGLVEVLTDLAQLDVDAVLAYNQAIDNIDELPIRDTLVSFRADHDRHITELGAMIASFGGVAPSLERDLKGFFIEGMTAIASKVGTRGALLAMIGNETLTNAKYKTALGKNLSQDVKVVVEQNYRDEQRHLAYIKDTLKAKFGVTSDSDRLRSDDQRASGIEQLPII